jgi:fatty-acyl-CoA synthase
LVQTLSGLSGEDTGATMFTPPDAADEHTWPLPLGPLLAWHAKYRASDPAVITAEGTLSYAELNAASDEVGAALIRWGVGRGDRIAVLSRNSAQYVAVYYAAAKLGAILIPLNNWHRVADHRAVLDDCDPRIVLCEPASLASVREAAGAAFAARICLMTPASGESCEPDVMWVPRLEALQNEGETLVVPWEVGLDDNHLMLYTSGTTGRPKGMVIPQGRTVSGALMIASGLRIRDDDRFINFFPPFHAGNWDNMVIYHSVGATEVLVPQFEPGEVIAAIERESVTTIDLIPTMLRSLLEHPAMSSERMRSLRMMYYASYDPTGLVDQARQLFGVPGQLEIIQTYGFSESAPWITCNHDTGRHGRPGTVGRPLPHLRVALLDDDGHEVPAGEVGEICVRGPHMSGYWKNPEETEAAFRGGWLHSGDLGVFDRDSFLTIVGRRKDVVRSGGHLVFAREVEMHLLAHPAVAEVAVIGVPDDVYEEAVLAVVVRSPDGPDSLDSELAQELQAFVRRRSAGYNVPRAIEFVSALPRNNLGKLVKEQLRTTYGDVFADRRAAVASDES